MTNIYWPIYKNLELEVEKLTYEIHIDDNQLEVYSSKISDLILRSAVEIESITKELYYKNGGKKDEIKFDEDGIKLLNQIWRLDKKAVIISSPNCFQSNRFIQPFKKSEKKPNKKLTYSWNNSYQHLKHNRALNFKFGNIRYLFDILSALFVLNIYYKDEKYDLVDSYKIVDFPLNQGSILFSVKIHKWFSYDSELNYRKKDDFDECIYLTKYTEESIENEKKINEFMRQKQTELTIKHPKFLEYIKNNDLKKYKGNNLMYDLLTKDEYKSYLRKVLNAIPKELEKTKFEAILNKNFV